MNNLDNKTDLILNDLASEDIDVKVNASVLLLNNSIYFELKENPSEEELLIKLLKIEELKTEEDLLFLKKCISYKRNRVLDISTYLLGELLKKSLFIDLFSDTYSLNAFIDTLNGTTPNVCRNTINILKYIDNPLFVLDELFGKLNDLTMTQLYWSLSAIREIIKREDLTLTEETLKQLINISDVFINNKEYQIREKVAEIVSVLTIKYKTTEVKNELNRLIDVIRKDNVFYVKNILTMNDLQGET
ncbi:MAG: hypothetical protein WCK67_07430 [bacterium]